MAKSFGMTDKSVAQTWYSSLWVHKVTSWQKLKDMLLTSFKASKQSPSLLRPCSSAIKK
jgi:hypothetical protein